MTRVSVLIPTYDHGPLIRHAIRSVQQQTWDDLEVLVVGDGAPDATREAVEAISREDPRVRWFGFEKGPRHGEIHRAKAVEQATGQVLAFLSDDDLYLPDHLERMLRLLETADLVHSPGCARLPDGSYRIWPLDLRLVTHRERLHARAAGASTLAGFPHSFGALSMELYRRVPGGLTTTPDGISTDVYFWSRCLSVDGVRIGVGRTPTVLLLESTQRREMSLEARDAELTELVPRLADPAWRADFDREMAALAMSRMCVQDEQLQRIHQSTAWRWRERLRGWLGRR